MKDRIAHIMRAKNLKASDFAALLGIQPSGISHILSGRNQPSLDFVKKIKETFPEYNLDWIVFGTGPITTSQPFPLKASPIENETQIEFNPTDVQDSGISITPEIPGTPGISEIPDITPIPSVVGNGPTNVKSMLILYDDGTFETYTPR